MLVRTNAQLNGKKGKMDGKAVGRKQVIRYILSKYYLVTFLTIFVTIVLVTLLKMEQLVHK